MRRSRPWNRLERFLLYGICGFAAEIVFTATWELVENGNRKLHGVTSMYAFFIYGFSTVVQEIMYLRMKGRVPLWARGLIYVTWSYLWEFSTGMLLRQFDACPWDYATYFRGHFWGLVTAEYLPVWFFACMLGEHILIHNALNMRWGPGHDVYDDSAKANLTEKNDSAAYKSKKVH
uniref:Uncharacterized protein n=1 Tax=Plectus sambesii TaxID=2011161 RepID=A0A914XN96_9BILA